MNRVVLIGAGGHSKVIQDIIKTSINCELYAILDDSFQIKETIDGILFNNTRKIADLIDKNLYFCVAIGNNQIRKKLVDSFNIPEEKYIALIHPSAVISDKVEIGHGSVIMPNVTINADAKIGNHAIINTNSVVEHDNNIEDFVHVSPGSILAGTVRVGEGTHVGAGVVTIPNKSIGSWTIIGAGSTIIENIPDGVTAVGSPTKVIKSNEKR